MVERYDAVIVGGGPAGLACGLELLDSKISCVVLEASGQLGGSLSEIKNTLRSFTGGFYESGEQLRIRLAELAEKMRLNYVLNARVETAELEKRSVVAAGKEYIGRTLVLATGSRPRRLSAPVQPLCRNDVLYSTEGRERELDGKTVAVVGGGDSALMECMGISPTASKIYLIHRKDKFRARPDVIDAVLADHKVTILLDAEVESIDGKQSLEGIKVRSSESGELRHLPVEKLVVKIGYAPNIEPFKGQVLTDRGGQVIVDQFMQTSVPNVFAAGDMVTPGYPRIAVASGHGALAAAKIRSIIEAQ